jgi:ribonuclease PH
MRQDGRRVDQPRPIEIIRPFLKYPPGSVLISTGNTKVICTACIEERVPNWLRGQGKGWITAEYSMIPGATETRTPRDISKGQINGRSQEIQRLIGRCLRSVVNMDVLGERTIWIDCDVIQADGGTRTAAITGGFVALVDALEKLKPTMMWETLPVIDWIAAISAGVVDGEPMLDLCYIEDSQAQVDMNFVMTGQGKVVEVQGAAEKNPFEVDQLNILLQMAKNGINNLIAMQKEVLGDVGLGIKVE